MIFGHFTVLVFCFIKVIYYQNNVVLPITYGALDKLISSSLLWREKKKEKLWITSVFSPEIYFGTRVSILSLWFMHFAVNVSRKKITLFCQFLGPRFWFGEETKNPIDNLFVFNRNILGVWMDFLRLMLISIFMYFDREIDSQRFLWLKLWVGVYFDFFLKVGSSLLFQFEAHLMKKNPVGFSTAHIPHLSSWLVFVWIWSWSQALKLL